MSEDIRSHNIGASDYSKYKIQPWDIWLEYNLNPWDADIVKRVLRNKPGERRLDYEKIIHVCQERIRQIDESYYPAGVGVPTKWVKEVADSIKQSYGEYEFRKKKENANENKTN